MMRLKRTLVVGLAFGVSIFFVGNIYADVFPFEGAGYVWEEGCWQEPDFDSMEEDPCYTVAEESPVHGALELTMEGEGVAQELIWFLTLKIDGIDYERRFRLMDFGGLSVDPSGRFINLHSYHCWDDVVEPGDTPDDPDQPDDPFVNPFLQLIMDAASKQDRAIGDEIIADELPCEGEECLPQPIVAQSGCHEMTIVIDLMTANGFIHLYEGHYAGDNFNELDFSGSLMINLMGE